MLFKPYAQIWLRYVRIPCTGEVFFYRDLDVAGP